MEMVEKLSQMPAFAESARGEKPISTVVKLCKDWGVRWAGKAIERQTWQRILSIVPFCQDDAVLSAIGDVKQLSGDFDKLTTLSRICQTVARFI